MLYQEITQYPMPPFESFKLVIFVIVQKYLKQIIKDISAFNLNHSEFLCVSLLLPQNDSTGILIKAQLLVKLWKISEAI